MAKGKYHSYSFFSLNRGALLSACLFVGLVIYCSLIGVPSALPYILNLTAVYAIPHIWWDQKIRKNHLNCEITPDGIIFYRKDKSKILVGPNQITKIEHFPSQENPNDKDFGLNMLSSGIRIVADGEKYLIFSKIRDFKEIKEQLEEWNINSVE